MHALLRRSRPTLAAVAGVALAAACGRVIAPAPPSGAPDATEAIMVAGAPVTIAARAARVLGEFTFTTRRFGQDSTWGFQPSDKIHARLRYTRPRNDSTRVLLELWGHCGQMPRCENQYGRAILAAIASEELAPPP
jgi:hypothetical protein